MNSREILEKIVNSEGSCEWVKDAGGNDICSKCPMSKLKKREDGNYLSCVEALTVEHLSEDGQNNKYKETAIRLLLDMSIEDMLRDS